MGLLDDLDDLAPASSSQSSTRAAGPSQVRDSSAACQSVRSKKQRLQRRSRSPTDLGPSSQEPLRPDYRAWSIPDLQVSSLVISVDLIDKLSGSQVKAAQYGFRPIKSRSLLEEQLYQVWDALHRRKSAAEQDEPAEISICSSSNPSTLGDTTVGASGSVTGGDIGDLTNRLMEEMTSDDDDNDEGDNDDEGRRTEEEEDDRRSEEGSEVPEPSPINVPQTLSQQLHKAITSDADLYKRILLFEPISFDEISSTAKRAGVKGLRSKEALRTWLDRQGICHYSGELTGQRVRY